MGITIFFSMFFLIFVFIIIFQSFSTAKKNGKNKENNDEKIMTIKSIFAKKETIQKENYNKKMKIFMHQIIIHRHLME